MHTITAAHATTAQPRTVRRYGLVLYFVGAYAWTWLFQLLSALMARHTISLPYRASSSKQLGFLAQRWPRSA
jgi:hypothetical protein